MSDTSTATINENLLEIDIDQIEPNPSQPRTHFDDNRLEELSQSIKSNGIVQPLLVRRLGGKYQLVAGERRWRAAQRAGLQKVPAVVRNIPDDKVLELALIENIQRQELNAIEEAHAYRGLIETLGLTQETVAQRVGRDRSFITNYLRLLRLPIEIQDFLVSEKLSVGHARALLGVDDQELQKKVAQNIIDKSLSVRETEKIIKALINNNGDESLTAQRRADTKQNDANFKAAESKLRRRLGTQVRILQNQSGDGGKIEIEYYNSIDLDRLYQVIVGAESETQAS